MQVLLHSLLLPQLVRFSLPSDSDTWLAFQSSLSAELTLHSSCLECDQEAYLSGAKVGKMISAYTNSKHDTADLITTKTSTPQKTPSL